MNSGSWAVLLLAAAAGIPALLRGAAERRLVALLGSPPPAHGTPSARVLVVGAGLLVAVAVGIVPGVLAACGTVAALRRRRTVQRHRRRRDEQARAVEACASLAAELRAGRAPEQALQVAAALASGPVGRALAAAGAAARLGGDVAEALAGRPEDDDRVLLRALAACWTVCSATGSGLAASIDRLTDGLRAAQAQRRTVDAELAGPRATALLLAALPLFGLLLGTGLGADPLHVLLRTPLGQLCLAGGLLLDLLGVWWTGRLVAAAGGVP